MTQTEIDAGPDYQTRASIHDGTLELETVCEPAAPNEEFFMERAWVKIPALVRYLDEHAPGWRDG